MNIIAIDCGASFIKGALFVNEAQAKALSVTAPPVNPSSDIKDTTHIASLLDIVSDMLAGLSEGINEAVLAMSNEMHGFILANEDGTPFTDYISWQRELGSVPEVLDLIGNNTYGGGGYVFLSGMPLRSGLPGPNLLHLIREGLIPSGHKLYFYTLGDYLIRRLSGHEPHCHPTNAAATGLFNLIASQWNYGYINAICNSHSIRFPEISSGIIDFTHRGTTFHALPALGDQQAALLGSDFRDEGTLQFNIGTGAQTSRIIHGADFGSWQVRPYFGGRFIRTIPHIPSGRALNVYVRFLKDMAGKFGVDISDGDIWHIIRTSASGSNHSGIVCDMSFFENAITDHTKGSISNIGEYELTVNNLMSSVLVQTADNFIAQAKKVNAGLPVPDNIIFSGGIARRWPELVSLITDGLGLNVPVSVSGNDALNGCCRYAMMQL